MDEVIACPPTYKLNFAEQIYAVEFSPFEWSQNLVCIAFEEEVSVGSIKFPDNEDVEEIIYTPLRTFHHETRIHSVAWSPETSLSVVPKIISFGVAGSDFKIRLFTSDLNDKDVFETLEGHKDYINAIAFESEGELLASVSDDHTCKLWAVKETPKLLATLYLKSPGMSVCWHNEESGKLLVAEKNGLIRLYNVRSQKAIMSMDASVVPLMSADWSLNPLKVACVSAGELVVWDVSRPSRPVISRTLHTEGSLIIKFSRSNENLVAGIGRPNNILKIINLKTKQVILSGKLKLIGGLSWHYKLPYVCAVEKPPSTPSIGLILIKAV
ncbi:nucleoporin Nup37 isoform X1 [Cotesia glomerata]|uniref:nucleoporin Nup37 isoform X1 n=1 Tax=Cotesia glomerata TaxID=32391 RepID=UPI001D01EB62|nr:nucleoporin Nup37 isoform X1 [Cotesia glomerata]